MPASPSIASSPARHRGKIIEWNTTKACGFADDGRQRIFVHIREFAERHKTPELGDELLYSMGTDAHGRACAQHIVHANDGGRLRLRHLALLALTLVIPALAIWRMTPPRLSLWCAGWIVATSAICYAFYAWDKSRARNGAWRHPESRLHFWELLGGWPGGFLAQRRLRHKSSKTGYLAVFWCIVVAHNYIALDWQLDWRLTRTAVSQIQTWLHDSTAPQSRVY